MFWLGCFVFSLNSLKQKFGAIDGAPELVDQER